MWWGGFEAKMIFFLCLWDTCCNIRNFICDVKAVVEERSLSRASLLTQIHQASPTAGLCSLLRPCLTFQQKSELVNTLSVMPETSFHATLMCAAERASPSSNSCHPCLPGSSAGLDLPLICRTWQPDSAGYPPSTPLCCFVPARDISCPCENKPEIWVGERMVQIGALGRYISCVSRPGHMIW